MGRASRVKAGRAELVDTVKRFRNHNPDGSITWGYTNTDGSFKATSALYLAP